ncbi:hypothetical protein H4P12_12975 [Paracoccus sp. 11-3]|uniref:Uncharacterized protein n=1 Tax=Paracoccus amoyensis TaxID=2760093 RepID=A0A926GPH3_9RHOB|nr:hypothetical protein [Paracoccus amoyensis]MBC9247595.1 hypothetical protein [Paracoccus amoyensis]
MADFAKSLGDCAENAGGIAVGMPDRWPVGDDPHGICADADATFGHEMADDIRHKPSSKLGYPITLVGDVSTGIFADARKYSKFIKTRIQFTQSYFCEDFSSRCMSESAPMIALFSDFSCSLSTGRIGTK